MTNSAPLTAEELAELHKVFVVGPTTILDTVDYGTLARLIAALRAERTEAERAWTAVDRLWGWMGADEVRVMRVVEPDLVDLAQRAHRRVSHGEGPEAERKRQ